MLSHQDSGVWHLAVHGPRPSTLLAAGAILGAVGRILLLFVHAETAWYAWLASLLLVGTGLMMSGMRPWLTAFALVPGSLFCLQGISLGLVMTAGLAAAAQTHELLALPKLLSLVMLGFLAQRQIDTRRRRWLIAAAGLASLKIILRHAGALPESSHAAEFSALMLMDLILVLFLTWALVQSAVVLRRVETAWTYRKQQESSASLDDFNPRPNIS